MSYAVGKLATLSPGTWATCRHLGQATVIGLLPLLKASDSTQGLQKTWLHGGSSFGSLRIFRQSAHVISSSIAEMSEKPSAMTVRREDPTIILAVRGLVPRSTFQGLGTRLDCLRACTYVERERGTYLHNQVHFQF